MNIIFGICYISIIFGWVNHFYYGECFKGDFQSSKEPQVNAIIQNHHLNKQIFPKESRWTFVHVAKYFAFQQGIFYHITKNTTMWQANI
jgi:hypothetical protein